MFENKVFVAVKALIVNDGKFLIVKRSSGARDNEGLWEMPGGRVEFGELPESALHREVFEEVGLNITDSQLLSSWSLMTDESTQLIGLNYVCHFEENDVSLSTEHDDYLWIEEGQLHEFLSKAIANDLSKCDLKNHLAK